MKKLLSCIFSVCATFSSFAADYTLTIQSSDSKGDLYYQVQKAWADQLTANSKGQLEVKIFPTNGIVAHSQTLDAMRLGLLDGHITSTNYFAKKDPAFGLIGNMVGAWSDTSQLLDYMNNGGGNELLTELYKPYGVQYVGATTTGVEAFVSTVPLDSVNDLKGVKLRAPGGLVYEVFQAAGANPVELPSSQVAEGLKQNAIQAADYSVFSANQNSGLNDIALHPIHPGFHSLPLIDFSISQKKWDSLPENIKALLTNGVRELATTITTKLKNNDEEALAVAKKNPQITIHNWSENERKKFRSIAQNQWSIYAKKSANAEKVYESVTRYLKDKGLL